MLLQEKVNEIFKFIDSLDDFNKMVEEKAENFNEAYEFFKKEHNLENLYFSKLISMDRDDYVFLEVRYEISDLYLTYLEANHRLPKDVVVERFIIKEEIEYDSLTYEKFMTSIVSAMRQQVEPDIVCGKKLYSFEAYLSRTELIKLSSPSDGLPDMIIDRTPMTYEELKNLKN